MLVALRDTRYVGWRPGSVGPIRVYRRGAGLNLTSVPCWRDTPRPAHTPAPNLQCPVLNLFLGRVSSISKTIVFDRSHVCRSEGRLSRACRNSQHDLLFSQGRAVWYEGSKKLCAEAHSMIFRFGKRGRSGMQGQNIPLRTHFVQLWTENSLRSTLD